MSDDPNPPPDDVLDYAAPGTGELDWVTVWKCRNSLEANLAVNKLRDSGVEARIDMEHAGGLGPITGQTSLFTSVQVAANDAADARRILQDVQDNKYIRGQAHCPRCGTLSNRTISWWRWLGAACLFFAIIFFEFDLHLLVLILMPIAGLLFFIH